MKKKIIVFFIGVFFISCNNSTSKDEVKNYVLMETNDPKGNSMKLSVSVKPDSLLEIIDTDGFKRKYLFNKGNGSFYQQRIINDFSGKTLDTALILTFSTVKDTSFQYRFNLTKYPPVQPLGSDDYNYEIKNTGNRCFVTIKSNIIGPSNREVFLYNKSYKMKMILIANNDYYYNFISPDLDVMSREVQLLREDPNLKLLKDRLE